MLVCTEANQTLIWELHDYGNLTLTLSRSDNEWIAMTAIAPLDSVSNPAELNDVLLRQGLALPLASIGIVSIDIDIFTWLTGSCLAIQSWCLFVLNYMPRPAQPWKSPT